MLLSQKTLFHSSISGVLLLNYLVTFFFNVLKHTQNHLSFYHIIIKDTSCSRK